MKASSLKSDITALIIIAGCILVGVFTFSSCQDDTDDSAPEITLNGNTTEDLFLQSTWTDPGAIAIDDKDGVVNVTVSGTFNVNQTGIYYLNYVATDDAGNTATATRTVKVTNELTSSDWVGNYSCQKDSAGTTLYTYSDSLGFSQTLNKNLVFMKFDNRSGADKLFNIFIEPSTAISPYNQIITAGSPAVAVTYVGAGTTVAGPPAQILLTVDETSGGVTTSYTYVMTRN
jgi:hypothetical protein